VFEVSRPVSVVCHGGGWFANTSLAAHTHARARTHTHTHSARQGFDSDVHALGLCLLHLCTGDAPYEETVEALRCPAALAGELAGLGVRGSALAGRATRREVEPFTICVAPP